MRDGHPLVRSLMMPVDDFAVVDSTATVVDALRALGQAQARVPEGRQAHRSVLVRDHETGLVIGKVGQRAIMRALVPQSRELFGSQLMQQAGVSEEMMDISMQGLEELEQDMDDLSRRALHHRVSDLILSEPESVEVDAPLSTIVRAFIDHDILSLLVTRHGQLIGVLRMTDLFDVISTAVLEAVDGA